MSWIGVKLLGAAAVGLTGVLALEITAPRDQPGGLVPVTAPPTTVSNGPPKAPPAPTAAQTAQWVSSILARPLFDRARRPPQVAASAAPQPVVAAPDAPPPRVTGIVVGPTARHAIFATGGDKPMIASEGEQVNGFTVQSIEAGKVVLVGPGGTREIHPTFNDASPQANPGALPNQPVAFPRPGSRLRG